MSRKLSDLIRTGAATISGDGETLIRVDPEAAVGHIEIDVDIKRIDQMAFCDCDQITSVRIPESVNEISAGAFLGCTSLKEIDVPDSVTKIGNHAFYGCGDMEYVNIPANASVGSDVFTNTNIDRFERSHEEVKEAELSMGHKNEKARDKEIEGQMTIDDLLEKLNSTHAKETEKEEKIEKSAEKEGFELGD